MNAMEQANSIERISQIGAVVNLFKSQFPDSSVNLSPWVKDENTAKFDDPDSIDFAFHFPRRSFVCQSQTILMQIRLPGTTIANPQRVIGVELSGHDYMGQQWRFATAGRWEFWGTVLPLPDAEQKLRQICLQILQVFNLVIKSGATENPQAITPRKTKAG